MESINRTMAPEAIPTERAGSPFILPVRRYFARWPGLAIPGWRKVRNGPSPDGQRGGAMTRPSQGNPWFISAFVLVIFLLAWHVFTLRPTFDPRGLTEE